MIIISPSKNLDLQTENFNFKATKPAFIANSLKIISKIKRLSSRDIKNLMKISDNLSELNYKRFQKINNESNLKKPAAFIFSGGTFNGLSIRSMNNSELLYAQNKLRILSGLYGVLKPFDLIEPYRLEMGLEFENIIGRNLYEFWQEEITNSINKDLKEFGSKYLFNLASKEYFSAIIHSNIKAEIVNFDFKKKKDSGFVNIGMQIKKLRGAMASFILKNKVDNIDKLKSFKEFGFNFHSFEKKNKQLSFICK